MKDDEQNRENSQFPQRQDIRALLNEGESKVPSMTASIMESIRRSEVLTRNEKINLPTTPVPNQVTHEIEPPRLKRHRNRKLYNILALSLIAALLIVAFGLLRFADTPGRNTTASTGIPISIPKTVNRIGVGTPTHATITSLWSSVIFTYTSHGNTVISNYNPVSKDLAVLVKTPYANATVNGVSHNGGEILYSVYDGSNTAYYIYPQATTTPIYTTSGDSKSAIWSTDNQMVLISSETGTVSVNVQTFKVEQLSLSLQSVSLLSFRDNTYLYYVVNTTNEAYATVGTLYRVQISNGTSQTPEQVSQGTDGSHFWLSPDGTKVYYNRSNQDANTLYVVNSDGSNPSIFRTDGGSIVGYAIDNSPLTLHNSNGKFSIVQQAIDSTAQTTVVADLAPGAIAVTSNNVAVSPYGHTLIAIATYSGTNDTALEQIWYVDLDTGKSNEISLPASGSDIHAVGWDRLQISATP